LGVQRSAYLLKRQSFTGPYQFPTSVTSANFTMEREREFMTNTCSI